MKIRLPFRRAVAFIVLAMMVFVQGAMAAHVCAGTVAPAAGMHQSSSDPCDPSDHEGAPPCAAHCDDSAQNVELWPNAGLATPLAPMRIAVVHVRDEGVAIAAPVEPSLQRSTSPPLTIRNCCFRI